MQLFAVKNRIINQQSFIIPFKENFHVESIKKEKHATAMAKEIKLLENILHLFTDISAA